ncbi:SDR family oxidoreductase, partial [Streptomyces sp900105755]|uniref:SDR family NAD(P)-dependent oxidoreductase n=1 Tax=Streptomyces sp. 900105755 TaxID=3154389 RepID=UPI0033320894
MSWTPWRPRTTSPSYRSTCPPRRGPSGWSSKPWSATAASTSSSNNVGAAEPRESFLKVSDADWQRIFDLTFFSAVRASRAALPHLVQDGGGAIVNISSINARLPFPMAVDYSAAKAALTNLNKALSEEFAPRACASTRSPRARSAPPSGPPPAASPTPPPRPPESPPRKRS